MLQEEFSAAEEDNEGDELRPQTSNVYIEEASYAMGELRGNISVHTAVKSTFTPAAQFWVNICKCHKCIQ